MDNTRLCEIEGCERKLLCKGMCATHYSRQHRGKSITARTKYEMTPSERFESFVFRLPIEDGCWLWTGFKQKKGYGYFRSGLYVYKAHRWAWEQVHGPIEPADLTIDHVVCGFTSCVNPAHMELVTRSENSRRARALRKERQTA